MLQCEDWVERIGLFVRVCANRLFEGTCLVEMAVFRVVLMRLFSLTELWYSLEGWLDKKRRPGPGISPGLLKVFEARVGEGSKLFF